MNKQPFFPENYQHAQHRIHEWLQSLRVHRPDTTLHEIPLYPEETLTFAWLSDHSPKARRALVLSAGLHGIEGYAGIAMIDIFIHEFLPYLPTDIALYIVPVINPWGLQHLRRVNAQNVDLNRNFLDSNAFRQNLNPEYTSLASLLHPEHPVSRLDRYLFYARILTALRTHGPKGLRDIFPRGQSVYPKGLHYTGKELQPEAQALLNLFNKIFERHSFIVCLDMHTGYGAKGELMIIVSGHDPRPVETLRERIGYPLLTKTATENFYPIYGDLATYLITQTITRGGPELYSFALEVGTFGNTPLPQLRSMRALILENQLYWYGATSKQVANWVRKEFLALFYPQDPSWRQRLVEQTRQAYQALLQNLLA